MKKLFLLVASISTLSAAAQVTIPFKFLKNNLDGVYKAKYMALDGGIVALPHLYWFPSVKNPSYFDDAPQFFQKNIISYNDSLSNIALYSEMASDYLGPVRVSVGASFAYPKSDTNSVEQQKINQKNFVQKFSTGGGTLVFNFILPVFAYQSKLFSANMTFGPRLSLDPPSFGVSGGKFAQNTAIGTDLQAQLKGVKEVFTFYGNARLSYVDGSSSFYNGLSLTGVNRKAFWLNNYTIGVNVKDIFTLSYTNFWGSKAIKDKLTSYLTFTVEPNFK